MPPTPTEDGIDLAPVGGSRLPGNCRFRASPHYNWGRDTFPNTVDGVKAVEDRGRCLHGNLMRTLPHDTLRQIRWAKNVTHAATSPSDPRATPPTTQRASRWPQNPSPRRSPRNAPSTQGSSPCATRLTSRSSAWSFAAGGPTRRSCVSSSSTGSKGLTHETVAEPMNMLETSDSTLLESVAGGSLFAQTHVKKLWVQTHDSGPPIVV